MTWTYDLATAIGKVRLTTADKDATDVIFTDEEIQVYLTIHSQNVNLASADVLEAWAAEYGQSPSSENIGDYKYTQKVIDNMLAMAKRLRDTDSSIPYFTWSEMDIGVIGDPTASTEMGE